MKDKIFVLIPTQIKEQGKEKASWQVLLRIAEKALTSFFDYLTHKNVEIVMSDDCSYYPAFEALSALVKQRFSNVGIIRWEGGIGYEKQEELGMRLALLKGADFWCYSEQDYLYTPFAFEKALDVFYHLPELNLISLYDHPGKHIEKVENDFVIDNQFKISPHYYTESLIWQQVCCCSSTSIWRTSYLRENWSWFQLLINEGNFRDHPRSFEYYSNGGLILEPTTSILQHMRISHNQDSPTFPFSYTTVLIVPVTSIRWFYRSLWLSVKRFGKKIRWIWWRLF